MSENTKKIVIEEGSFDWAVYMLCHRCAVSLALPTGGKNIYSLSTYNGNVYVHTTGGYVPWHTHRDVDFKKMKKDQEIACVPFERYFQRGLNSDEAFCLIQMNEGTGVRRANNDFYLDKCVIYKDKKIRFFDTLFVPKPNDIYPEARFSIDDIQACDWEEVAL